MADPICKVCGGRGHDGHTDPNGEPNPNFCLNCNGTGRAPDNDSVIAPPVRGDTALLFTPYTAVPAEGCRIGLVTCRDCGAVVMLDETIDWPMVHRAWHMRTLAAGPENPNAHLLRPDLLEDEQVLENVEKAREFFEREGVAGPENPEEES